MNEASPQHPIRVDAHCHNYDVNTQHAAADRESTRQTGRIVRISCALTKNQMDWHRKQPEPNLAISAGIHPLSSYSDPAELPMLEPLCRNKQIVALGETGTDRRGTSRKEQTAILEHHLALARKYKIPLIFHVNGWWDLFFECLKPYQGNVQGYVHSFAGSNEILERLWEAGLDVSLGPSSLRMSDETLHHLAAHGRFLIETDAPWRKPDFIADTFFSFRHLPLVAAHIAGALKIPLERLMTIQYETASDFYPFLED